MTSTAWPWEGGCRCGEVRLRVSVAPLLSMACHCHGCQRMTASAFSLSLAIPNAGFEVTKGEPVRGGIGRDPAQHFHCPTCKSWLFTRMQPDFGFVNLRPTMLDEHQWFEPFVETQTAEKLPWVSTPARHSFERFPPMEAFQGLIADYAARRA